MKKKFYFKNQRCIITHIHRPKLEIISALSQCDSSFLSDFMGKTGVMNQCIKPLSTSMKVCGPAITCLGYERLLRRMAINLAQPGDVLVIAAGGKSNRSCFGGTTAKIMAMKKIAGVVIDGMTRDMTEIIQQIFPTFVCGVTPLNYHYPTDMVHHSSVNIQVICGGVSVSPGDIIKGDADGVVVIPREFAEEYSQEILETYKEKIADRKLVKNFTPFSVKKELIKLGYKIE